jgi:predicted unusual protein kinase regulating ubiquinone biosynthesis (AarF/ABC1/UbiB family)
VRTGLQLASENVAKDKIPTSRVGRTARIGGLAAGQAIRQAGTRAANVTRNTDQRKVALEKRQIEAAEQIVAALGTMKGAAMKVGQVLSFLDVGLVPDEYRDEFQRKLAALRDAAPNVAFKDMRKVLEEELDERMGEVFAEFDEKPVAAASIGQVYRARLRDGREVAVKIQYPGVAAAVRSDMQNLGLILRLAKRIAPGLDPQSIGREISERIHDELDYELEAQNQRTLARIFRGHPFIVVPDVITSLSRERVMVSEYVQGTGFEDLKGYPQEERDRIGEILYRFYFGCLYRHHQFSGVRLNSRFRWRARSSRATPRRSCAWAPRSASSPTPRSSIPNGCWPISGPPHPGTRSIRTPSSPPTTPPRC